MYKFIPELLQYGRLDVAHSVLVFVTRRIAYSLAHNRLGLLLNSSCVTVLHQCSTGAMQLDSD